jgi:hypothetical protein
MIKADHNRPAVISAIHSLKYSDLVRRAFDQDQQCIVKRGYEKTIHTRLIVRVVMRIKLAC